MKHGTQKKLAEKAGISAPYFNQILSGKKRPLWDVAKRIALVTNTDPVMWMEAQPDTLRRLIETGIDNDMQ